MCKKSACDHTKYAYQLKSSCDGFKDIFDQLNSGQSSGVNDGGKNSITYSSTEIPFIANSDISEALKRLPYIDNKAFLMSTVGVACNCGSTTFEEFVAYDECEPHYYDDLFEKNERYYKLDLIIEVNLQWK